ncbi:MAG TPA: PKD domain-containing protein [Phototrophicaceae bacterium]|jgi:WD40 repeat protein|nr:PKD domain-containing protein [Phototrophicaceae bacterium]
MKSKFWVCIIMIFWLVSGVQAQVPDPTGVVTALDWSSTGDLVAVAVGVPQTVPCFNNPDYYVIRLLHSDGSLYRELRRHACAITSLAFSPDGSQLLSVDRSGLILLWDVTSGELLLTTEGMFPWQKIAWSADANSALLIETFTAFLRPAPYKDGYLSLVAGHKTGFTGDFTDGSWSPDGTRVAVSNNDGSVGIWNVNTTHRSQILYRFQGHTSPVKTVDWNPMGELVASGDMNGVIKIWSAVNGQDVKTISAHSGVVNDLEWSSDGKYLATAGEDGMVKVWAVGTGAEVASFDYEAPIHAIAWKPSPTQYQIAFGGEGIPGQGLNGEAEFQTLSLVSLGLPLASAGDDQVVAGNGTSASVTLDGSGSGDPDGSIISYSWSEGGSIIATGATPTLTLGVGVHTITLTVTDNDNQTATDDVVITVLAETATHTPTLTPTATDTPPNTAIFTSTFTPTFTPSFTYPATFTLTYTRTPSKTPLPARNTDNPVPSATPTN